MGATVVGAIVVGAAVVVVGVFRAAVVGAIGVGATVVVAGVFRAAFVVCVRHIKNIKNYPLKDSIFMFVDFYATKFS